MTCVRAFVVRSCLFLVGSAYQLASAQTGITARVSVASSGLQGNSSSIFPSISSDGCYVAFASFANNLVPGDTNRAWDVFVRDRLTNQTTRVSVDSSGLQSNGNSRLPSISPDGRYVAFDSAAYNLVPGDTNSWSDVFVHDCQTNQTTRVSVASSGLQGNSNSIFPSISSDGRYVAFASFANNLVPGDTNSAWDVFVRDRLTNQTTRVSVDSSGLQADGFSYSASISSDGRYVAFESDANNLVPRDTNGEADIFVHDRQTNQTTRVSVDSSGVQSNGSANNDGDGYPSISSDGRYVAFVSDANNLVPRDSNGATDVFVHDRQTKQTTRVSVDSSGQQGNGNSAGTRVSSDGRYVGFQSFANNLVPGDTNRAGDSFVRDRLTNQTTRVSVDSSDLQGNSSSGGVSISSDGRYVAFESDASNLVPGDTNGWQDVFVRNRISASGGMAVSSVTAVQLGQMPGLIDVSYALSGPSGSSTTVALAISRDGGPTFPIVPLSVSGAIGPGQTPASGKHITWNAAIDIPGESGTNYVGRLSVENASYANSNVFSITTSQNGSLGGIVRDASAGSPLADVTVTISGSPPTSTNASGAFAFASLSPGTKSVSFAKSGYHALSQTATVNASSTTAMQVSLVPIGGSSSFGIVRAWARFCSPEQRALYLHQVSLDETFTAQVDWGTHPPGQLRWILPDGTQLDDPCPGTNGSRTFNVGYAFGLGGTLKVAAVTGDSVPQVSAPFTLNFTVIPPPTGVAATKLYALPWVNALTYTSPSISDGPGFPASAGVDSGTIPTWIPLFGSEAYTIGGLFDAGIEVDGAGSAEATVVAIDLELDKPIKLAGVEFNPAVGGSILWNWSEQLSAWDTGGSMSLGLHASTDVPPVPVVFLLPPPLPPLPGYWRGNIGLDLDATLEITGFLQGQPTFNGVVAVTPNAEAMLALGIVDFFAIEGYLGGKAPIALQYPTKPTLQALHIAFSGGVRIVTLVFTVDFPLLQYTWPPDTALTANGPGPTSARLRMLPRTYLAPTRSYARFVVNQPESLSLSNTYSTEAALQLNVFGQSTPALSNAGGDLMLAWIWDDPSRSPTNRTELVWSRRDAGTDQWSSFAPIANDGTADFHPQIAELPNGDELVCWENVKEILAEPTDPNDPAQVQAKYNEMRSKMEIVVSRYSAAANSWSAPTVLSNNTVLDCVPHIATAANGTAMLTWIRNASNDPIGTQIQPSSVEFARFDGSAWSGPATAAPSVPSVVKCDLAYDGNEATLPFIGDGDDNISTGGDRELFALRYSGGAWQPVERLTNDALEDASPQATYTTPGQALIVWYRAGNIVYSTRSLPSQIQTAVAGSGESMGLSDFRVSFGPSGRIGLVWQDASADTVDLWHALYDASTQRWSERQRLTTDSRLEYGFAAVHDATGRLLVAYDKAQIVYESRTVVVDGDPVQIDNIPTPGQVDLYFLTHSSVLDLAVTAADISVDPVNPLPGTTATLRATIRNPGDVPASNVLVDFYDGASLVGFATLTGPLVGGGSAVVQASWNVPTSGAPHAITVVVDPASALGDMDVANNAATLEHVVQPDAIVETLSIQRQANGSHTFVVRVRNAGSAALPPTDVDFCLGSPQGIRLGTVSIPVALVPGAFHEASLSWTYAGQSHLPTRATVCAFVDPHEQIDEFDEHNNTKSALLWSLRQRK